MGFVGSMEQSLNAPRETAKTVAESPRATAVPFVECPLFSFPFLFGTRLDARGALREGLFQFTTWIDGIPVGVQGRIIDGELRVSDFWVQTKF